MGRFFLAEPTVHARTLLPSTRGEWRWAELTVIRAAGDPLHAMIENTMGGGTKGLAFRRLDVVGE